MNIIKNHNYYKLVGGKLFSIIGTFVQSTAFSLYIIDTFNDSLIFATILMSASDTKNCFRTFRRGFR